MAPARMFTLLSVPALRVSDPTESCVRSDAVRSPCKSVFVTQSYACLQEALLRVRARNIPSVISSLRRESLAPLGNAVYACKFTVSMIMLTDTMVSASATTPFKAGDSTPWPSTHCRLSCETIQPHANLGP